VDKIGGPQEKNRAHSLFIKSESEYWKDSRFSAGFIPLTPIHIFPSDVPSDEVLRGHPALISNERRDPFFETLQRTCWDLLQLETPSHPSRLNASRAITMKANARLTAHTVRSLLWGAKLGWTTLTANRTSVRATLKEVKARRGYEEAFESQCNDDKGNTMLAAIHLVDPRSLAEGMRTKGNTAAENRL
jgi:hypothetical protein